MPPRSFLACVLLLCAASVCEAQRFGIPFRPRLPVIRQPTPLPTVRPVFGPNFTNTQPTGGYAASDPAGDRQLWGPGTAPTAVGTRSTGVDYTKPFPASPAPANNGWWAWVLLAVVCFVAVVMLVVGITRGGSKPPPHLPPGFFTPPAPPPTVLVRVVSVPEGEAPEWVRQAWVGLVLPAVDNRPVPGQEVMSGRPSVAPAYQVKTTIALTLLEVGERAGAADWWRENTTEANDPAQHFLFSPDCCSPLDGRANGSGGVH